MAPKRKLKIENGEVKASTAAAGGTTRVTRSSTRRDDTAPAKAAADPQPPKKKKQKSKTTPEQKSEAPPPSLVAESTVPGTSKTVIIEHCKQCNSFKTRAFLVKNGLEKEVSGVNVLVNPEKPRRGCFEIREEGGDIFVSLLNLKRPFRLMKELDMDEFLVSLRTLVLIKCLERLNTPSVMWYFYCSSICMDLKSMWNW